MTDNKFPKGIYFIELLYSVVIHADASKFCNLSDNF